MPSSDAIQGQVRVNILDVNTVNPRYPPATLLYRFNRAAGDVARRSKCVQNTASINTVAGTREYDLPTDFDQTRLVTFKDDTSSIVREIYEAPVADTVDTFTIGYPCYWSRWGTKLRLQFPAATSVVGGIQLFYYAVPADLGAFVGTEYTGIPSKYHQALEYRITVLMLEVDEEPAKARDWNTLYEDEIERVRREQARASTATQGRIGAFAGARY